MWFPQWNTVEYYAALKKENPVTFYNICKPRGHYPRQSKPVTEGQILHYSTPMESLMSLKS